MITNLLNLAINILVKKIEIMLFLNGQLIKKNILKDTIVEMQVSKILSQEDIFLKLSLKFVIKLPLFV